jgi:hypothetical protein
MKAMAALKIFKKSKTPFHYIPGPHLPMVLLLVNIAGFNYVRT